jgi:hypothetical protein
MNLSQFGQHISGLRSGFKKKNSMKAKSDEPLTTFATTHTDSKALHKTSSDAAIGAPAIFSVLLDFFVPGLH